MKRTFIIFTMTFCVMGLWAQSSDVKARCDYTVKKLKLDKTKKAAFKPVLTNYLIEMESVKKDYKALKTKYKGAYKEGVLTDAQGQQLMDAHWESDQRELDTKKKYAPQFTKLIGGAKAYKAFDYSGDSMKKIKGE